jgi:hypothetical protein
MIIGEKRWIFESTSWCIAQQAFPSLLIPISGPFTQLTLKHLSVVPSNALNE